MTADDQMRAQRNALLLLALGGALLIAGAIIFVLTNNAVAGIVAALLGASAEGAGVKKLLDARKKT
jgi:hypothetical protein